MNGELLNILEAIARDKGIDKEILIKAVESSLVSAARKSSEPIAKKKNIAVYIDRQKGAIKAFAELTVIDNDKSPSPDEITLSNAKKIQPDIKVEDKINVDLTPTDFGRIAAQSAKQIIIQKIREAERDIIYDEFKDRVGDIVMGTIRRKEKGNVIVDLGRTEAVLPLKEQCPEERYHIGNRLRTYIAEVKLQAKGPEIVLSRTHPGLVKKLFELEIPEIVDGTVEIKGIVRDPGYRCKVAVNSNNPKVDPIGACVGMRGSRIKNIVRELENEKLDIIKWESDVSKYVANALSPAEIKEVIVHENEKKLEVRVAEDQLSVTIGKRGQNVRLASRLTGWDIDVRKVEEEVPQEVPATSEAEPLITPATEAPVTEPSEPSPSMQEPDETEKKPQETETVSEVIEPGSSAQAQPLHVGAGQGLDKLELSQKKIDALIQAGFDSIEKIANADISQLLGLEGFGEKTAQKIKGKAINLLNEGRKTSNE